MEPMCISHLTFGQFPLVYFATLNFNVALFYGTARGAKLCTFFLSAEDNYELIRVKTTSCGDIGTQVSLK